MRLVHWLFVLSMAFFVGGIGLVIASARTARRAEARAPATRGPDVTPVASVKQIMQGMTGPAATVVYESVGTTITAAGATTWAPKTASEWEKVGTSAAALAESGNLMMIAGRAVDSGDWMQMSRALVDGAQAALQATTSKNAEALFAAGEPINASCDACHQKYWRQ